MLVFIAVPIKYITIVFRYYCFVIFILIGKAFLIQKSLAG
jgi:hypothetical protein